MKLRFKIFTVTIAMACMTYLNAFSATSLKRVSQWPHTTAESYLQPTPNAITSGPDGLLIWATGDTVSIVNEEDLSIEGRTFRVETPSIIYDIQYSSASGTETLYIAAGEGGLQIFDISDLNDIKHKASLTDLADNPGSLLEDKVPEIDARGLGYYNGYIFLADSNFGLRVIDVSDPTAPKEVRDPADPNVFSSYKQPNTSGSYDTTGGYTNADVIEFDGKVYAFILDYYYGLKVFDITDPTEISDPVTKDMRTNIFYGNIAPVTDVFAEISDGRLYATVTAVNPSGNKTALSRLDILSNTNKLEEGSIINVGRFETPGSATGVFTLKDFAYVADDDEGLQIVDISATPEDDVVLTYTTVNDTEDPVKGSYSLHLKETTLSIYMSAAENGLQKIDVSTPASPVYGQILYSPVSGDSICVSGDYTYLLDADSGLRIFDTSTPSDVKLTGFLENTDPSNDIAVSGDYAYIASGTAGVKIAAISSKEGPVFNDQVMDTPGTATAVAIYESASKTYACVADGTNGYVLIDITDPSNPGDAVATDSTDYTKGTATDVYVYGSYAYFADGSEGLKIVDISDPVNPKVIASKSFSGETVAVAVFEKESSVYAAMANSSGGIYIEDVTNPSLIPEIISTIAPPETGSFVSLDIYDNYLFAASGSGGVLAFDMTDPSQPVAAGTYATKSSTEDISAFKKADTVYIGAADKYNGMVLYTVYNSENEDPAEPMNSPADSSCFINTAAEFVSTDFENQIIGLIRKLSPRIF